MTCVTVHKCSSVNHNILKQPVSLVVLYNLGSHSLIKQLKDLYRDALIQRVCCVQMLPIASFNALSRTEDILNVDLL